MLTNETITKLQDMRLSVMVRSIIGTEWNGAVWQLHRYLHWQAVSVPRPGIGSEAYPLEQEENPTEPTEGQLSQPSGCVVSGVSSRSFSRRFLAVVTLLDEQCLGLRPIFVPYGQHIFHLIAPL